MSSKMYQYYRRSTNHYKSCDQQSEVILQLDSKMNGKTNRKSTAIQNDLESEKLL